MLYPLENSYLQDLHFSSFLCSHLLCLLSPSAPSHPPPAPISTVLWLLTVFSLLSIHSFLFILHSSLGLQNLGHVPGDTVFLAESYKATGIGNSTKTQANCELRCCRGAGTCEGSSCVWQAAAWEDDNELPGSGDSGGAYALPLRSTASLTGSQEVEAVMPG